MGIPDQGWHATLSCYPENGPKYWKPKCISSVSLLIKPLSLCWNAGKWELSLVNCIQEILRTPKEWYLTWTESDSTLFEQTFEHWYSHMPKLQFPLDLETLEYPEICEYNFQGLENPGDFPWFLKTLELVTLSDITCFKPIWSQFFVRSALPEYCWRCACLYPELELTNRLNMLEVGETCSSQALLWLLPYADIHQHYWDLPSVTFVCLVLQSKWFESPLNSCARQEWEPSWAAHLVHTVILSAVRRSLCSMVVKQMAQSSPSQLLPLLCVSEVCEDLRSLVVWYQTHYFSKVGFCLA